MRNLSSIGALSAVAVIVAAIASTGSQAQTKPIFLQQNFERFRPLFYSAPQGSLVIPYNVFMSLESEESTDLFVRGMTRFGYLPNPPSKLNPDGLPVGFLYETATRGSFLGMTCAACHTRQIEYDNRTLQIDGAPANADMYAFIKALSEALAVTRDTPAKLERYLARMEKRPAQRMTAKQIVTELESLAADWRVYVMQSTPKAAAWGHARLDAFNMIFNRLTAMDTGIPENARPPEAPVSYPFLWNTSWHDRVQWDGLAQNVLLVERLGRNVGEALGVFAELDFTRKQYVYPSSVRVSSQLAIETWIEKLTAPQWPEFFPPADQSRLARGKSLYAERCASCHESVLAKDQNKMRNIVMVPVDVVGTDRVMAEVAPTRKAIFDGKQHLAAALAATAVKGVILDNLGAVTRAVLAGDGRWEALTWRRDHPNASVGDCAPTTVPVPPTTGQRESEVLKNALTYTATIQRKVESANCLQYKARPLNGIWATAPYLHNGSVPNLHELLLPSRTRAPGAGELRSDTFYVGSNRFDAQRVGFVSTESPGAFKFDTSVPGNGNQGHEGTAYGTDLSPADRSALLEYLKTL